MKIKVLKTMLIYITGFQASQFSLIHCLNCIPLWLKANKSLDRLTLPPCHSLWLIDKRLIFLVLGDQSQILSMSLEEFSRLKTDQFEALQDMGWCQMEETVQVYVVLIIYVIYLKQAVYECTIWNTWTMTSLLRCLLLVLTMYCPGWVYLNVYIRVTALNGGI